MGNGDVVVLVDRDDIQIDVASRETAHRDGLLHRAVSVFVFNDRGQLLLQRRAGTKGLFAGRWANTCCTHPRVGETPVAAGERRLREEMGLTVTLEEVGTFIYRAEDEHSGYLEHELDHVLVGRSDAVPNLDPNEADAHRWADIGHLRSVVTGSEYAPWLRSALAEFPLLGQTPQ